MRYRGLFRSVVGTKRGGQRRFAKAIICVSSIGNNDKLGRILVVSNRREVAAVCVLLGTLCSTSGKISTEVRSRIRRMVFGQRYSRGCGMGLGPMGASGRRLVLLVGSGMSGVSEGSGICGGCIVFGGLVRRAITGKRRLGSVLRKVGGLRVMRVVLSGLRKSRPRGVFRSVGSAKLRLSLTSLVEGCLLVSSRGRSRLCRRC